MSSAPSGNVPRRAVHIGKYEVISHIATGGMGAVYKARDTELRRDVALKILAPEMAAKPGLLERFRREARHAARLRHENVVAIYEFGEAGGTYFLALEYVDGIDLGEYIDRKGKLDPEEARLITLQAARALEHAHAHAIIHRDVKPSNFLIARPNGGLLVKLTDMGLAREAGDEDFRVTRAGTTVGTIDYIAPEQARDSALADIRSDLYSLGCTLFHMLAGQAPFSEGGLTERLYKHIEAEPPNVLDFNARVSPALCAVLYRLLSKKPEDRYQTPAELVHDLLHLDKVAIQRTAPVRRDVLADLADLEDPNRGRQRKSRGDIRKPPPRPINRKVADETRETPAAKTGTIVIPDHLKPWLLGAGGVVLLVVLGIVLVVALRAGLGRPRVEATESKTLVAGEALVDSPSRDTELDRNKKPGPSAPLTVAGKPKEPRWPPLYEPTVPLDVERLKQDFTEPWSARTPLPKDTAVFRVSRFPHNSDRPHFDSLAVACAAAPADRVTAIEIHDNGPIFTAAVAVKNRSLVIRAGAGFHPLLIWDLTAGERESPPIPRADAFLSVMQGGLTLEGLELAVRREGFAEPLAFLRVLNGDLVARGCAFSVAGKQSGTVAIARLEGPAGSNPSRCHLSSCFGRGGQLQVADVEGPAAQVSMENCLFVGGPAPLLHVRGYDQPRISRTPIASPEVGDCRWPIRLELGARFSVAFVRALEGTIG